MELEWEPVENVFGYEVQLSPKGGGEALVFRTIENKLMQEVPVGIYTLRIRSRDKEIENRWSPWSDSVDLEVLVKELLPLKPENEAILTAQGDGREDVKFSWTPVEKTKGYTLRIWTEETKNKPLTFSTRNHAQHLKLLPGRVYFWQVTFESSTAVSYAQETRTSMFLLQGRKLVQPVIKPVPSMVEVKELSWIKSPRAKTYKIKLSYRHLDEEKFSLQKEDEVSIDKWSVERLKPGVYKLEVVARAPRYADSDAGVREFTVKPTETELTQAFNNGSQNR